jgi:hypothetical protein
VNVYTNKAEWNKTKIHAHFPGPLKPVKKTLIQRLKVSKELLVKLLAFLESSGNLQRAAFGRQVKDLLDGLHTIEMDNMSRLKKLNKLVADYLTIVLAELELITTKKGEDVPPDESRCKKLDQKTPRRCMKSRSHDGECAFTPKGSICADTVRALVDSLTVGDIKSLSGLDDVKVLKGRDNFARLREIAKQVLEPDEVKPFIKQCDDVELYYQTDYVPHLQRDGTHKCNCLTCGFNDKGESHRRRQRYSFFFQGINSSQERVSNLPIRNLPAVVSRFNRDYSMVPVLLQFVTGTAVLLLVVHSTCWYSKLCLMPIFSYYDVTIPILTCDDKYFTHRFLLCLFSLFLLKDSPNDIICPEKDNHLPSCKKCKQGFALITEL